MEEVPIFRKTAGVNRKQSEWAKTLRYNGMTSADRKAVMIAVLGWPFFGILGWILAFAVFFVCRLAYWLLVRPVILLKLRYAMFDIRDRLRLMAIRKEIGGKQPAYGILEEFCNLSLCTMEYVGLAVIGLASKNQTSVLRVERNLEIIRDADPRLREIFDEIGRVNVGAIICNSPGWWPWIILSVLASYWSQKARQRIDRWKRDAMGMTYSEA